MKPNSKKSSAKTTSATTCRPPSRVLRTCSSGWKAGQWTQRGSPPSGAVFLCALRWPFFALLAVESLPRRPLRLFSANSAVQCFLKPGHSFSREFDCLQDKPTTGLEKKLPALGVREGRNCPISGLQIIRRRHQNLHPAHARRDRNHVE